MNRMPKKTSTAVMREMLRDARQRGNVFTWGILVSIARRRGLAKEVAEELEKGEPRRYVHRLRDRSTSPRRVATRRTRNRPR